MMIWSGKELNYIYSKSAQGYAHKANNTPCEDNSMSFQDRDRIILSTCDGHGGEVYIRSRTGSMLASCALFNVFSKPNMLRTHLFSKDSFLEQLKLEILCEWNTLVNKDLKYRPIRKSELKGLSESQIDSLKLNPTKAYGTTLTGALLVKNKLLVVGIGDTEAMYVSKGQLHRVFDDEDEPVANVTYSLCQDDAFAHMKIKLLDYKSIDGLILCSDGLTSPYQSYANFNESFVKVLMNKYLIEHNFNYIDRLIDQLASKLGVGDDVSLACLIKSNAYRCYYK